jgi:hypothetical protein
MALFPKQGTLERVLIDKMIEREPNGVSHLDFIGTGITEDNIDQIVSNLSNGMYESEDDHLLKEDA